MLQHSPHGHQAKKIREYQVHIQLKQPVQNARDDQQAVQVREYTSSLKLTCSTHEMASRLYRSESPHPA
jgi:hypothetical protein